MVKNRQPGFFFSEYPWQDISCFKCVFNDRSAIVEFSIVEFETRINYSFSVKEEEIQRKIFFGPKPNIRNWNSLNGFARAVAMRWSMYKDKKTRHFIGSASHAGGSSCAGSIRNLTRGREQRRLGSRWWSTNKKCFPWWAVKKERSNSIQVDGATDNQNVPLSPRGGVNNPIACEPPIRWTWNEKWR